MDKRNFIIKKIAISLKDLKKGQISKPIKYPNGYLLLKVNNKKEMKQKIDINKELDEKIKFERNKQLNQFSLLYYKKLKQKIQKLMNTNYILIVLGEPYSVFSEIIGKYFKKKKNLKKK